MKLSPVLLAAVSADQEFCLLINSSAFFGFSRPSDFQTPSLGALAEKLQFLGIFI